MGGYGSTRWGFVRTRDSVEEYIKLDADYIWTELFGFTGFQSAWRSLPCWTLTSTGDWYRMTCPASSEWTFGRDITIAIDRKRYGAQDWHPARDQQLRFLTVDTALGVQRRWLLCPYCGSRRKFLYCSPYSLLVRCRECHDLAYASSKRNRRLGVSFFSLVASCLEGLTEEERHYCVTKATMTSFGRDPDHSTRNRRRAQLRRQKAWLAVSARRQIDQ